MSKLLRTNLRVVEDLYAARIMFNWALLDSSVIMPIADTNVSTLAVCNVCAVVSTSP